MKRARVYVGGVPAGELQELKRGTQYRVVYASDYTGPSISLMMPTTRLVYEFDRFPPFFEGLLPEGFMLEALLRLAKIDRNDLFTQLVTVGAELVGNVTVESIP